MLEIVRIVWAINQSFPLSLYVDKHYFALQHKSWGTLAPGLAQGPAEREPMLYDAYQAQQDLLAPVRAVAGFVQTAFGASVGACGRPAWPGRRTRRGDPMRPACLR